jgi:pimeloyl-ACP methyl ester carboxylesterase
MSGAPFLGDLAKRFTVYAPAHPGFGPGHGVEHLDDVLDLTVYHLDLLDELRLQKTHVIGHSLGGMIAAEIAALAPQILDRLVPVGRMLLAQFKDPDLALDSYRCLASAGKFLWPIPDKGLKKRLHRLKMPTLVVWGASDGLIPTAYADAFRAAIPSSRVTILNGAGHLPMLEQREAFVDSVVRFLTH